MRRSSGAGDGGLDRVGDLSYMVARIPVGESRGAVNLDIDGAVRAGHCDKARLGGRALIANGLPAVDCDCSTSAAFTLLEHVDRDVRRPDSQSAHAGILAVDSLRSLEFTPDRGVIIMDLIGTLTSTRIETGFFDYRIPETHTGVELDRRKATAWLRGSRRYRNSNTGTRGGRGRCR